MQTREEKKALLQRAMDEGLGVQACKFEQIFCGIYTILEVASVGCTVCELRNRKNKAITVLELDHYLFRIVEPRITAEDLCEAIDRQEAYRRSQRLYCEDDIALWNLAKRYREQESNTTNEVSEAGE